MNEAVADLLAYVLRKNQMSATGDMEKVAKMYIQKGVPREAIKKHLSFAYSIKK